MKRREVITFVGGALVAWPLAARAQQPDRMRRIGVLMNLAADDMEGQQRLAAFLQGLQEAGWEVGRIDRRYRAQFQICDGTACARAGRLSGCGCPYCSGAAKGYSNSAHRVYKYRRSGRCWAGREFGAAERQCHWLFLV